MSVTVFKNARIIDGSSDEALDPVDVVVEGQYIREISQGENLSDAQVIDVSGRYLMPGLIDSHVHIVSVVANLGVNATLPDSLVMARSMKIQREMLMRGFTTVRDVGGADLGQVRAYEEGLVDGPRPVICCKALSQTGGHCDFRGPFSSAPDVMAGRLGSLGYVCDGVSEVRRFARDQLKNGARFIKVMANGGVASPTDPIHALGFSIEELKAIVEEAENAGTYVSAHLYTDAAIRRAVECGIHSLEHCNLIQPETARLAAERGAIAVPTLIAYKKIVEIGEKVGMGATAIGKVDEVHRAGMASLDIMRNAGLEMAFGSDLLGEMQTFQSEEFSLLSAVLSNREIIRSATSVGARLCHMEGKIGTIAPGAYADLIVVDKNPLTDISVLEKQGQYLSLIMQEGKIKKNAL